MTFEPGIIRVAKLDVRGTLRDAEANNVMPFVLPDAGIFDRASFFAAAKSTFPVDPLIVGSSSWDALSDSLWEGLYNLPCERIAVLWPNAIEIERRSPQDIAIAMDVLLQVSRFLADPKATMGRTKSMTIIVEF